MVTADVVDVLVRLANSEAVAKFERCWLDDVGTWCDDEEEGN
jgi:hypothetical protein